MGSGLAEITRLIAQFREEEKKFKKNHKKAVKLIAFIISAFVLVSILVAVFVPLSILFLHPQWEYSQKFEIGSALGYDINGDKCIVAVLGSTESEIIIPQKYNNKPVVGIKEKAFEGNKTMTSIFIPKTVESIGTNAFSGTALLDIDNATEDGVYYAGDISSDSVARKYGFLNEMKKTTTVWAIGIDSERHSVSFRDDCVGIASNVLDRVKGNSEIVLPKSVKYLNSQSFTTTGITITICNTETLVKIENTPEQLRASNITLKVPARLYNEYRKLGYDIGGLLKNGEEIPIAFDSMGGNIEYGKSGINVSHPLTWDRVKTQYNVPTPTRAGYTFKGWYLRSDCNDDDAIEDDYTFNEWTVLYAKWEGKAVSISIMYCYDCDGVTNKFYHNPQEVKAGDIITLMENTFHKDGHVFVGWSQKKDGATFYYDPGDEYTVPFEQADTGVVTFWAQWREVPSE